MDKIDFLSMGALTSLINASSNPCVSIYLPTHRRAPEGRQDPLRFKNLLRAAERRLIDSGLRAKEAALLLEPASSRLPDAEFWRHQSDGLAVFLSSEVQRLHRLPLSFPEMAVVANRFHIRPLLPLFVSDGHFYVLALSQSQVRLLEGSRHSVAEIELANAPNSLAQTLSNRKLEKQLQYHVGTPERRSGRDPLFHGHGPDAGWRKDLILRYFREIDESLRDVLEVSGAPLVLAGVAYYFPIYRAANSYPYLLGEGIPGNPENQRPEELHEQAWKLVEHHFAEEQMNAASRYRALTGTGRTTDDLSETIEAARSGRVDVLFVTQESSLQTNRERTDERLPRANRAQPRADGEGGILEQEELLDICTTETLLNGGKVHAGDLGGLAGADSSPVAAILRY